MAVASFHRPRLPGRGVRSGAAQTGELAGLWNWILAATRLPFGLFTSLGPTPLVAGSARIMRCDWTTGLSISGDFPRGGAARPPGHFLVPSPSLGKLVESGGTGAWPGRYLVRGPGAGRGEWGAVPQGPHPQVSRPGLWMEREEGSLGKTRQLSDWARSAGPGPAWWPGLLGSWAGLPGSRA